MISGASAGGGNGSSGVMDDKASATLSINRFNMVFAQTTINKEEKSLTHKNSSDNMSIHNSIADPGEYNGGLNRVPSNRPVSPTAAQIHVCVRTKN
jgi:hypothetical protein